MTCQHGRRPVSYTHLEYEGTVYKVKEAQEELEKALKSGDEVAIEKAKKKKNAAEQNQANAQANVEKSKDKAISNITDCLVFRLFYICLCISLILFCCVLFLLRFLYSNFIA